MNEAFPTDYKSILGRVDAVDPAGYGKSRNFTDGAVTHLSPYVSRGVISVKQVMDTVLKKDYKAYQTQRLIQELLWREYFQRVWQHFDDGIFDDIKHPQPDVHNHKIPEVIVEAKSGIRVFDDLINNLYKTGYMHNHVRMYTSAICCNIAKSHWLQPSRWLYYHLLDGDVASNTLNWQWVAGSFSDKKYYCNQENINKYTHTDQQATFMDHDYKTIISMDVPEVLVKLKVPLFETVLPGTDAPVIDKAKPTLIYNSYNLSPEWRKDEETNRVLLLEPSHFEKYPVSENVLKFILDLSENIKGIQVFTGEFKDLEKLCGEIVFKEHTAFKHYSGTADERDWISEDVSGYYPSYFQFYKNVSKSLKKIEQKSSM